MEHPFPSEFWLTILLGLLLGSFLIKLILIACYIVATRFFHFALFCVTRYGQ